MLEFDNVLVTTKKYVDDKFIIPSGSGNDFTVSGADTDGGYIELNIREGNVSGDGTFNASKTMYIDDYDFLLSSNSYVGLSESGLVYLENGRLTTGVSKRDPSTIQVNTLYDISSATPIVITDEATTTGAHYAQDYSTNWTSNTSFDNVLVNKKYVDDNITNYGDIIDSSGIKGNGTDYGIITMPSIPTISEHFILTVRGRISNGITNGTIVSVESANSTTVPALVIRHLNGFLICEYADTSNSYIEIYNKALTVDDYDTDYIFQFYKYGNGGADFTIRDANNLSIIDSNTIFNSTPNQTLSSNIGILASYNEAVNINNIITGFTVKSIMCSDNGTTSVYTSFNSKDLNIIDNLNNNNIGTLSSIDLYTNNDTIFDQNLSSYSNVLFNSANVNYMNTNTIKSYSISTTAPYTNPAEINIDNYNINLQIGSEYANSPGDFRIGTLDLNFDTNGHFNIDCNNTSGGPSNITNTNGIGVSINKVYSISPVSAVLPNIGEANNRFNNIYLSNAPDVGSDSRLKDNIQTVSNALDKIKQLEGRTYTKFNSFTRLYDSYNNSTKSVDSDLTDIGRVSSGLIAQDVYNIIPSVVNVPADPINDMYSIKYEELSAYYIEAIKELKNETFYGVDAFDLRDSSLSTVIGVNVGSTIGELGYELQTGPGTITNDSVNEYDTIWSSSSGWAKIIVDTSNSTMTIDNLEFSQFFSYDDIYIMVEPTYVSTAYTNQFVKLTYSIGNGDYTGGILGTNVENIFSEAETNGNLEVKLTIVGSIRPTNPSVGTQFFDYILNKPIWYGQSGWVDSSGLSV